MDNNMEYLFNEELNLGDTFHPSWFSETQVCEDNKHDLFMQILIFISVVQFGLLLSAGIVAIFVYKPMIQKSMSEQFDFDYPEEPYEYKYNLKNVSDENEETNPNNFVFENTPDGTVIMKYSVSDEGFHYWSNKTIRFNYLDVVARKYVKTFLCKNLYKHNGIYDEDSDETDYESSNEDCDTTDISRNDIKETETTIVSEDKNTNEPEEESVFITKKNPNYTNKPNSAGDKSTNSIQKVRNKFMNKGKISEFRILQDYSDVNQEPIKKMTFDMFKQMFYGNNTS